MGALSFNLKEIKMLSLEKMIAAGFPLAIAHEALVHPELIPAEMHEVLDDGYVAPPVEEFLDVEPTIETLEDVPPLPPVEILEDEEEEEVEEDPTVLEVDLGEGA